MKVLLTGGNGMVGKNILENPSAKHFELRAPDRTELDLLDGSAVDALLKQFKPDLIVHAAGLVGGIQANLNSPKSFLYDNLVMALNLINAASRSGVEKLINLGSSCMYPRDANNPLREEMLLTGALEPTNEGYALSKVVAAKLCQYISQQEASLHYKTLIPCNLYGRHDTFDEVTGHMIPAVIKRVHDAKMTGRDVIEAWGDGQARREFMAASDFSDFIFFAIDHFADLPDLMNVGLGEDLSIADYYRIISAVVGFNGSISYNPDRPVGMQRKVVDISKQKQLGWAPKLSVNEGVQMAYDYFQSVQSA